MQTLPARVGDSVDDIDTPALVVDLDAFERNLDLMANAVRGAGVALRPHAKSHKCPDIAHAQIERGAVGICCQKVGEAEAFVAAGHPRRARHQRNRRAEEAARGSRRLAQRRDDRRARRRRGGRAASRRRGARGRRHARRAGRDRRRRASLRRRAGRAARGARAGRSRARRALRFRGLHAYHGAAQHLRTPEERRAAIARAGRARARDEGGRSRRPASHAAIVTGAGTGTWQHERDSGVYTELQPGSYIFMDADYHRNALAPDEHAFRAEPLRRSRR